MIEGSSSRQGIRPREPLATRVVVRRSRQGLELRVDGTLASVHCQVSPLTEVVWWALAAPAVLVPREHRRRVLFLGLGGGSAARAVRALDPEAELVGVERDRSVLRLAQHHFGMDSLGVEVIVEDALRYLSQERRRFDLIVEDLFVGTPRSVRKPDWLLEEGYRLIRKRLRPDGLVSSNTIHETAAVVRAMRPIGARILSLSVRDHWNCILVCGRNLPHARGVRRRLRPYGNFELLLSHLTVRNR